MIDQLKARVVNSTTALFSHGPQPLANTLSYRGDPGLLGPDSVSWQVIGDVTAFVGGIRALVVQTAHPEVVAGVDEHSQYRTDPLGRLSRTSAYVTETTYGAMPEVEAAVAVVRNAHRPVRGVSERQQPYSAGQPAMAAWVHNVLTDSFLVGFQTYGPRALSADEADRFVAEQARIGQPLPAFHQGGTEPGGGHQRQHDADIAGEFKQQQQGRQRRPGTAGQHRGHAHHGVGGRFGYGQVQAAFAEQGQIRPPQIRWHC